MIRYPPDAVGLKPSAMGSEAHLRGLDRIHFWKTISRHSDERERYSTLGARASRPLVLAKRAGRPRTQEGQKT
ncbi:MAG: hypothetical protein EOM24_28605 [Chloroflexia bacterium]|nr:hypothetical protein [Chloroflexia bacterium]